MKPWTLIAPVVLGLAIAGAFLAWPPSELPTAEPTLVANAPEGPARAPSAPTVVVPPAASPSPAEKALLAYQPHPGLPGRGQLDEIYAAGVRPSAAAARAAHDLVGRTSIDEKIALSRIMASLYNSENSTGLNDQLLADLQLLASDPSPELARVASMAYARLGHTQQAEQLLDTAYRKGSMPAEQYYGELAHLAMDAPPAAQATLFKKLKDSRSPYAVDITTFMLNNRSELIASWSPETRGHVQELLATNAPRFPDGIGQVGMTDLIRYNHWLRLTTRLSTGAADAELDAQIIERLDQPGVDPRMALSYLMSPAGQERARGGAQADGIDRLIASTARYALQHPSNRMLTELQGTIEANRLAAGPTR